MDQVPKHQTIQYDYTYSVTIYIKHVYIYIFKKKKLYQASDLKTAPSFFQPQLSSKCPKRWGHNSIFSCVTVGSLRVILQQLETTP